MKDPGTLRPGAGWTEDVVAKVNQKNDGFIVSHLFARDIACKKCKKKTNWHCIHNATGDIHWLQICSNNNNNLANSHRQTHAHPGSLFPIDIPPLRASPPTMTGAQ